MDFLSLKLPNDVINVINSYLIKKIPKDDKRYKILHKHFIQKKEFEKDYFWKFDGKFRCKIAYLNTKFFFSIQYLPNMWVEYQFHNLFTNEYKSDRCFFPNFIYNIDNINNNYWQQHNGVSWISNPNTVNLVNIET